MVKAVFGMGIALINHWEIIKKNYNPSIVIDNNEKKWGEVDSNTNLKCFSLADAKELGKLEVLITVGDPYAIRMIAEQLEEENIKYVVLMDQLDEWCKYLELPSHLAGIKKEQNKIIIFNTPEHDNVGDHLISISIMEYLKRTFPDNYIYEVTDIEYLWFHNKIKEYISEDDKILVTGGGFLGSLWLYNGEDNVRSIISEYPNNRIVILPQTIYFEDNQRGKIEYKKSEEIYNQHSNLVICAREKRSYEILKRMMKNTNNVVLFPDLALLYDVKNKKKYRNKKEAMICIRTDKERVLPQSSLHEIESVLKKDGYLLKRTSMHSGKFEGLAGRTRQVEEKLNEIADADIVVTDTLHCMISSYLVGSTCYAFNNISGKVGNVYEWIKGDKHILFCDKVEDFNAQWPPRMEFNKHFTSFERDRYKESLKKIIEG